MDTVLFRKWFGLSSGRVFSWKKPCWCFHNNYELFTYSSGQTLFQIKIPHKTVYVYVRFSSRSNRSNIDSAISKFTGHCSWLDRFLLSLHCSNTFKAHLVAFPVLGRM